MKKTIMRSYYLLLLLSGGLITSVLRADRLQPISKESSPEQDVPLCVNGTCDTGLVQEVLEEFKDCDLSAPEARKPSGLEVFGRKWGIFFAYKIYEYRYVLGLTLLCTLCYKTTRKPGTR